MNSRTNQLLTLAGRFGTPLYVYDAEIIREQISYLKDCFNTPHFHIHFAAKALTNRNILRLVHREGCGLDTVSIEEMEIAISAGVPVEDINFTPSGAELSEYVYALDHGITMHVDNIQILEYISEHYPGTDVVLRFNPDIRAGEHLQLQVGGRGSKFGFTEKEIPIVRDLVSGLNIKIVGVHAHVGSDISQAENFVKAFDFLMERAEEYPDDLRYINFGGGYKVAYRDGDKVTDMQTLGRSVVASFESFCVKHGKKLQLIMEPGKFLVGRAGTFLADVTAKKKMKGTTVAFLNTGFNHLIRPMYYGAFHQIDNISNPDDENRTYDIVGYLCETDNFAARRELPKIRTGDTLAFNNAGAYCYMMASNYNSRVRPAEVLIDGDEARLIRRRETVEDIVATEILV